ncbi:hypothetical protein Dalk_3427 [Desulfatibacillum aliphaticivorans]|uniref:Uncharacterized protein n=1 Tax=Desulfatibacillum aliphaticivorans TaxID=218208 RepID=B8FLG9_DESAL|nr:hypothetical protein [Desulfatibacillum aliphaticivorans]ACL05115.1 hypothetical protein Dalk_3427 [Desulfatibacillum aliphaticivorans]
MAFDEEMTCCEKTILSELQGAWGLLRDAVAESQDFPEGRRALFQIDEAMSWEIVRDLRRMPAFLLVVRNICTMGEAPQEVMDYIRYVDEILTEVLEEYPQ